MFGEENNNLNLPYFTVTIVRHGETESNEKRRAEGVGSDSPLTDIGIQQAEQLAMVMKYEEFDSIYSSDLTRTSKTCQIIIGGDDEIKKKNKKIILNKSLRERDLGKLEGVSVIDYVKEAAKAGFTLANL